LADQRRINVAITRARRHLCVVCDSQTCKNNAFLKSFLDYCEKYADVRSGFDYENDSTIISSGADNELDFFSKILNFKNYRFPKALHPNKIIVLLRKNKKIIKLKIMIQFKSKVKKINYLKKKL